MAALILSGGLCFKKGQMMSFSRQVSGSSIEFPRFVAIPSKQHRILITLSRSRISNSLNTKFDIVMETSPAVLTEFLRREFPASIPVILTVQACLVVLCLTKRFNPEIGKLVIDAVTKKAAELSLVNILQCLGCLSLININWDQLRELIRALLLTKSPSEVLDPLAPVVPVENKSLTESVPKSPEDISNYSKVCSMLLELSLQSYEENFKRNLLTDETMHLLKDSDLKDAEIPLGPRVLILNHIKRKKRIQRA